MRILSERSLNTSSARSVSFASAATSLPASHRPSAQLCHSWVSKRTLHGLRLGHPPRTPHNHPPRAQSRNTPNSEVDTLKATTNYPDNSEVHCEPPKIFLNALRITSVNAGRTWPGQVLPALPPSAQAWRISPSSTRLSARDNRASSGVHADRSAHKLEYGWCTHGN